LLPISSILAHFSHFSHFTHFSPGQMSWATKD
jgi:hypothetical protein